MTDTVAVAHKVPEEQPDTEEEALGEIVAESVRLVVAVGVNACVVGNDVGLMLPVPLNVMLGEAELLLLRDCVTLTIALLLTLSV